MNALTSSRPSEVAIKSVSARESRSTRSSCAALGRGTHMEVDWLWVLHCNATDHPWTVIWSTFGDVVVPDVPRGMALFPLFIPPARSSSTPRFSHIVRRSLNSAQRNSQGAAYLPIVSTRRSGHSPPLVNREQLRAGLGEGTGASSPKP